jgi:hypothetical protein
VGTICQDTPYLSFNHPHYSFSPPAESFSQSLLISRWVSQFTTNDMAGVNVKIGPPFSAVNSCPMNLPAASCGVSVYIFCPSLDGRGSRGG